MDPPGSSSDGFADPVEEAPLPFRTEEGAEELAAGTGVVPQTGSIAVELIDLSARMGAMLDPFEKGERNIPVAHLTDEPCHAAETPVERPHRRPVGRGQEFLKDAEPGPQTTQLSVETMKAFRGWVRVIDHPVDLP
jgi:hypothetical protein